VSRLFIKFFRILDPNCPAASVRATSVMENTRPAIEIIELDMVDRICLYESTDPLRKARYGISIPSPELESR